MHPDHTFDAPGNDRHLLPRRLGAAHDLARRLPDQGRLVEDPFAGDHEVGLGERGIEPRALEHPFRAVLQLRFRKEHQSRPQTASGAAHRHRSQLRPARLLPELCEPGEAGGELGNLLGARAFLGTKDGRGAARPKEWRGDVRQRHHARRNSPAGPERRELRQRAAAVEEWLTRGIFEGPAKPARGARAPVHGRGTAQADNDRLGPAVRGCPDQLAHPACGGAHRIAVFGLNQCEAAGGRAFDDGGLAVDPAELRRDGIADRPGHLQPLAQRAGRQHDIQQPVASVGDRTHQHRRARDGAAHAGGDRLCDLTRSKRSFEGRGSDEDDGRHGGNIKRETP